MMWPYQVKSCSVMARPSGSFELLSITCDPPLTTPHRIPAVEAFVAGAAADGDGAADVAGGGVGLKVTALLTHRVGDDGEAGGGGGVGGFRFSASTLTPAPPPQGGGGNRGTGPAFQAR